MEGRMAARVALSAATYAIDKPYTYLVPEELIPRLREGMRVMIPFGAGNRRAEGMVLSVGELEDDPSKYKPILTLLDEEPVLDREGLQLAMWMRERYFCTVYEAARAMLPAGLYFSLQDRYVIVPGITEEEAYEGAGRSELAHSVLDLLYAGGGRGELGHIRTAFGSRDPGPALRRLSERGIIRLETSASRAVSDKQERVAVLAVPPEEAMAQVTPRRRSAPMRYAVMELLSALGEAAAKDICYFTGATMATLRSLVKSGLITLEEREQLRRVDPGPVESAGPVVLNEEQQKAFDGLNALAGSGKAAASLLWGVTGSGKTQVYLKLIQATLDRGKSALALVPEIALTPQLLRLFASHFGDRVAVLHSSLRAGERYDEWKRIRSGAARVVVGTRSAVFAPLADLGLVILDEEQEGSYKSEQVPKYHAREVAKYRCAHHNALLVLGSATPSVESMYQAQKGVYHLFTLTQRYNRKNLPRVEIVDLKEELKQGNGGSISTPLRQALEENLSRGEQSILFLNRRGASRMVSCGECGAVPTCPRCSVYLTYHSANGRLMCHYCGHSEPMFRECPHCGGLLNFQGAGTQRLQTELERLFPGTEILRLDADAVSATHSHEALLDRFRQEKIPILVGTQMVAKGLDFENVTLVGVISADQSLYVDDYRASERTFSLLTQVVGRAGRGSKTGRAIIQTFTPENDVITLAARQDYGGFYAQEIGMRQLRGCPPFRDLFVLTASGPEESGVIRTALRLRRALESWLQHPQCQIGPVQLLGPAPAAVTKVNNRYRYRLTLSAKNDRTTRQLIAHLLRCAQQDKENRGVSVYADTDPME